MKKQDGTYTTTLEETTNLVINTLIPNSPGTYNTDPKTAGSYEYVPCTIEELKTALWRTSPRKAPGSDNITATIARKSLPTIKDTFCNLVNSCLSTGLFPKTWKNAEVTIIQKDKSSDPAEVKSYRPISLLPVMGKALEKIIYDRLLEETKERRSKLQHGFCKGKSTYFAIKGLMDWHDSRTDKYTLAVFLDISGAFDNLEWTILHQDLEKLGCSESTKAITKSYLHNRTASINIGGVRKTIGLAKGCPQGSIFGPVLWNATVEDLLRTELPCYAHIQAYADDSDVGLSR